jgi:hypothetical protein
MRRRQQPAHRTAHRHAGGEAVLAVTTGGANSSDTAAIVADRADRPLPQSQLRRRRTLGRPWDHDHRARRVLGARPGDRPDTQQFGQAAVTAAT